MKKRIASAIFASALIVAAAGCGNQPATTTAANTTAAPAANNDTTTAAPAATDAAPAATDAAPAANTAEAKDDGDTLSILTWNGNSDTTKMIDYFCQKKGYDKSKVTLVGVGDDGQGARDGYSQYLLGDGDADIMICDGDWIQLYANSDQTLDYSAIGLSKSDFPDSFSYVLSFGTAKDGSFKATSFQACPGGFVYRSDLAKEYLGVNNPDEMQAAIDDWSKFEEAAKKVKEMSNGKCALQATEAGLWQVFQSNRTQPWVVDGKLVLDNCGDFIDIAKRWYDEGYISHDAQAWQSSWYAALQDGTAMGEFMASWGLTNNEGSQVYSFSKNGQMGDQFALCGGPNGWYWGGSWMAVASKCDNKTLAKEFIEFYCKDADTMKGYAGGDDSVGWAATQDFMNNTKVMADLATSNPLLGGQDHYAVLSAVLARLDLEGKITEFDSKIKGDFNDAVNAYLEGTENNAGEKVDSKDKCLEFFKDKVAADLPDVTVD